MKVPVMVPPSSFTQFFQEVSTQKWGLPLLCFSEGMFCVVLLLDVSALFVLHRLEGCWQAETCLFQHNSVGPLVAHRLGQGTEMPAIQRSCAWMKSTGLSLSYMWSFHGNPFLRSYLTSQKKHLLNIEWMYVWVNEWMNLPLVMHSNKEKEI